MKSKNKKHDDIPMVFMAECTVDEIFTLRKQHLEYLTKEQVFDMLDTMRDAYLAENKLANDRQSDIVEYEILTEKLQKNLNKAMFHIGSLEFDSKRKGVSNGQNKQ